MVRQRAGRSSLNPALGAISAAILGLVPSIAIQAANAADDFPSSELFRNLQLTTLACGRDNSSTPCEQARSQADRLLDHPRLAALCKDTLWTVRQKARVASVNSLERRETIDRAARDLPLLCRQKVQPASRPEEQRPPGSGSGVGGGGAGSGGSGGGQPGFNFGAPSR
jgi:hypothetical protein